MKFKIITLGCRSNQYESQAYRDQLQELGLEETDGCADLCIINSCSVTASAESSSKKQIRQLIEENPGARVVLTGCAATKFSGDGVIVINNENKENLVADLFPELDAPQFGISRFVGHTRAFVKVQDGCNSFCSYCIIPYVRGRSRSRPFDDIINEVHTLVKNGYREVVLTGINIGDYKWQDKCFVDLVRAVDGVKGLDRLRISSIDPNDIDDELCDVILNGRVTCSSLHLVLQSGSDFILKRMNRKYDRQMFFDVVDKLRSVDEDFTFTTDIIVGFPGETEEHFQETLDVMDRVRFAKVHMFPFSVREGTRAARFSDFVSKGEQRRRREIILQRAEEHAFALREKYLSKTMLVLTEKVDPSVLGMIPAHTDNFLKVWVKGDCRQANELIEVQILENNSDGLVGSQKF